MEFKVKKLFSLIQSIQFEKISFYIKEEASMFLPLMYESVTKGELRNADIHYIYCELAEGMSSHLDKLINLIRAERLVVVYIVLYFHPSRQQLETLYTSIAKSNRLASFQIDHNVEPEMNRSEFQRIQNPKSVMLSWLLNKGQRSYDYVCIANTQIEFDVDMPTYGFATKMLQLRGVYPADCISILLQSSQVESFYGSCSDLPENPCLVNKSLTELDIYINELSFNRENFARITHFANLQLLTFTMGSFKLPLPSIGNRIFESLIHLPHLKGINVHRVEKNLRLARHIVEGIAHCLDKTIHPSSLHEINTSVSGSINTDAKESQLQHLSLYTELEPQINHKSTCVESNMCQLISLVSRLKKTLTQKALPRLDIIVGYNSFLNYMHLFKPNGFSSFVDLFPPNEGFVVKHDYWGMRDDDSKLVRFIRSERLEDNDRFLYF